MDFSGVQYVKVDLDKFVKEDKKQKKKEKKRLKKVWFLCSPRTAYALTQDCLVRSLTASSLPMLYADCLSQHSTVHNTYRA